MIITVTLNAAIDKSLSVPSFRARAPPPDRRAARARRRQGRQHRAHAEDARPAGDRDRLRRRRRPARRSSRSSTEESILNDFVRIREESRTNTSVLDPTTGEQTEINEQRPAGLGAARSSSFREKLLYLARGAAIVVFAGSLPRGVEPDLYASWCASCASST